MIAMMQDDDWSVKKESVWAIANATSGGTKAQVCDTNLTIPTLHTNPQSMQVHYMVQQGCIGPLSKLLDAKEPLTRTATLIVPLTLL